MLIPKWRNGPCHTTGNLRATTSRQSPIRKPINFVFLPIHDVKKISQACYSDGIPSTCLWYFFHRTRKSTEFTVLTRIGVWVKTKIKILYPRCKFYIYYLKKKNLVAQNVRVNTRIQAWSLLISKWEITSVSKTAILQMDPFSYNVVSINSSPLLVCYQLCWIITKNYQCLFKIDSVIETISPGDEIVPVSFSIEGRQPFAWVLSRFPVRNSPINIC